MCEGNRITSDCEAADHDCSQCASSDGHGGCAHGNAPEPGERTMSDYLELTYRQNQVIALKLDAYAKDLEKAGRLEVADKLRKAIPEFEKGNMLIGIAKDMLKQ